MCETLKTDGKPLAPTPANIRYANRVADEIRQKIRFGTYVHADYFPDSEHSTSGRSITRGEQLDKWLLTQAHKANS
ncbi:Arm DNA-binding domain-containing protein, partial [Klebsiella variicola]|uniref:Arm DNA-binding domain-containing protein n=2 Tax=Pseudomonadota TaxID=1224 RepID=UPI0039C1D65E